MHSPSSIHMKCIVVDDEPMARDVIRRYVEKVPNLELVEEFGNAIDASVFLMDQSVDIIFVDIKMPQLSGTDFIRSLRSTPRVIFTTAHKEFAYDGFELDAVDYLLKPIRFDRFLKAVNKAFHKSPQEQDKENKQDQITSASPFIYLRVSRKMVKVLLDDILYIESDKDYVKVFTAKGFIITRQTIASVEAMLPASRFIRIHRSYIVSLQKIKSFNHELVEIGNKELPIGKLYRNGFIKFAG